MKIGLIADIHADLPSFLKALRIFKKVGVHKILCAGDLVDRGSEGDKVVALIRTLKIPCVLGNHDETASDNQLWIKSNMNMSLGHTQKMLLKQETLNYLQELPRSLRFQWDDRHILLVHGSPASNLEYLRPQTSHTQFAEHAQKSKADIIICGHTHTLMHYLVDDVHFINPGAVYPYVSSCTCAILSLPDIQLTVHHLRDGREEILIAQAPPN